MNWVDFLLLALVAVSGIRGLRLGAAAQVLSFGGFCLGLFLGALVVPAVVGSVKGNARSLVVLGCRLRRRLYLRRRRPAHRRPLLPAVLKRVHLGAVDSVAGVAVAVVATLVAAWLVGSFVANSRFTTLDGAVDQSHILRAMDRILPPVPSVFSRVESFLDSAGFPIVFAGLPPEAGPPVSLPTNAAVRAAVVKAERSTVQIVGAGCGVIQEGSGFVVAPGLVVTNAHVVAGIPHPLVLDSGGRHQTTVVLFDPRLDLAVLRVPGLNDPALPIDPSIVDRGTSGVVLGYPEGGPFLYRPAAVAAYFEATGLDIYGKTQTLRGVYQIQAVVQPGNSGGPVDLLGRRRRAHSRRHRHRRRLRPVDRQSRCGLRAGHGRRPGRREPGPSVVRVRWVPAPASPIERRRDRVRVVSHGAGGGRGKNEAVTLPIEDYGLIGDLHTAGLVGRNGSIDWLCLPRFDSGSCFARLLGNDDHGFWQIAPVVEQYESRRQYRKDTLVLETEFETSTGVVKLIDCMPIRDNDPQVVRLVEGVSGHVDMRMVLAIRFAYGSITPWVRSSGRLTTAVAGPDALSLWSPVATHGEDLKTVADFTVKQGEQVPFVLTWFPSHWEAPRPVDARFAVEDTQMWWEDWASTCTFLGPRRDAVVRSLITLKALTYQPTGGIVAAPTTSLPETLGGGRNWDYRYCWLRDATLTLESLMRGGYFDEAMAWRNWLLRTVAGDPADLQIMYGPGGERRLDEWEVPWLPGYEQSAPVRIGNAAAGQFQLDVYGEVMSALYVASKVGGVLSETVWDLQKILMNFVKNMWIATRRRHLGGPRAAPALHPLEDDGLGGRRPGHQDGDRMRGSGTGGRMADLGRHHPRPGLQRRLQHQGRGLHPVLRLRRPRRQSPHDAPGRFPPGHR